MIPGSRASGMRRTRSGPNEARTGAIADSGAARPDALKKYFLMLFVFLVYL